MIENKKAMAHNILRFMDRDNVKATDICKTLGFKQNTFSDWVNAKTYPRIDAIEKLARFFGVSKAALVEEEPNHELKLSDDERRFIIEYRKLNKDSQDALREFLTYRNAKIENRRDE